MTLLPAAVRPFAGSAFVVASLSLVAVVAPLVALAQGAGSGTNGAAAPGAGSTQSGTTPAAAANGSGANAASSPASTPGVIEATIPSLESAWDNRASSHSQIVAFLKARPRLPEDYDVQWRVSRLAYYAGFFIVTSDAQKADRMEVFRVGSESGDKARRLQPGRVEGHYWYAISVGGLGIAKGVMASLSSAEPMRDALDEAVKLDSRYHFAGPLRVRGRLYYKLPGGIISFGDNKKALADLRKAVELGPESKLNYVYLAEVVEKVENASAAVKILEIAKRLPDVAGELEEASYRRDLADLERKFK